jgi:predicted CxxxxCH...CXXCH cytochrome family protein
MTGTRHSRFLVLALLLGALVATGCSSSTSTGGIIDASGGHPANFVDTHPAFAQPDGSACIACHGDNLRGGVSGVSCFSASLDGVGCHASGPAFHPASWVDARAVGTAAFHGTAFLNNTLINGVGCDACHVLNDKCTQCHFTFAAAPVRRTPAGTAVQHTWSATQTAGHSAPEFFNDNAVRPVCQACHETNNRFGQSPFCHNCHEPFPSFHPAGWENADSHGAAAKDAPSPDRGFAYCQSCHGTAFAGAGNAPSCVNNAACHGISGNPATPSALNQAPHSPRQWRTSASTPRTHTTTSADSGNAAVCFACHVNLSNYIGPPSPPTGFVFDPNAAAGCYNNSMCHSGTVPHALGAAWLTGAQHGQTAKSDLTYCQGCHGSPATPAPGSNPRFNVAVNPANANSSCENCHAAGTAHPVPGFPAGVARWYLHRLSGNKQAACGQCHDTVNPPPQAAGFSGPNCRTCHIHGAPLAATSCTTCHTSPPGGPFADGSPPNVFPNIAGKHNVHNAFNGVTGVCDTCHSGFGFGSNSGTTTRHFMDNVVDVAFLAAFNAESGAAAYGPATRTCTNVSCHGGQQTPDWQTAAADAIDVPNACTSCHASGTTQFNSFNSGEHNRHVSEFGLSAATCKRCHNTTTLTGAHFAFLGTTAMEGPASATIGGGTTSVVSYIPATRTCTPQSGIGCHGSETW